MGIFSKSNLPESDLKRNKFDLSFQNNLTTNFGVLKPVFCKEVIPGDTFDIDTTFGLRFMPTVFPIQNRARASVKFFYVRKRSLYEDFKEWSTGNDSNLAGLPYLDPSAYSFKDKKDFLKLGGLADSLGLPVSVTYPKTDYTDYFTQSALSPSGTSSSSYYKVSEWADFAQNPFRYSGYFWLNTKGDTFGGLSDLNTVDVRLGVDTFSVPLLNSSSIVSQRQQTPANGTWSFDLRSPLPMVGQLFGYATRLLDSAGSAEFMVNYIKHNVGKTVQFDSIGAMIGQGSAPSPNTAAPASLTDFYQSAFWRKLISKGFTLYPILAAASSSSENVASRMYVYSVGDAIDAQTLQPIITIPDNVDFENLPPLPFDDRGLPSNFPASVQFYLLAVAPIETIETFPLSTNTPATFSFPIVFRDRDDAYLTGSSFTNSYTYFETADVSELSEYFDDNPYYYPLSRLPYTQSVPISPYEIPWWNSEHKLSALPFRAYEMIYNSFYRDERNNPFQIRGVSYYDKFLPTTEGGSDSTVYTLHQVNWEQDQFTTALPSPQQGAAPLVGISSTGVATLAMDDGQLVNVQLETADDGDTVVSYSQTSDLSPTVQRTLVNAATQGISINDFRAVNALQRYLEKNLRQGLRYKDMIQSRWGVSPSYSELNMPEFIGGVVEDVIPSQVNANSSTADEPLGSYAGQLYCQGSSKHNVHKFCDEAGYIIGILDVTPVPVYNSLLPKHFTKFDVLDFYNPEFGHIGYQPITLGELAPNTVLTSDSKMNTTFGYQRAWYDYLCSNDEVHGDFRGSLRDFLIYRDFVNPPTLSEEFLTVSDDETNNIFSVQTDADGKEVDKILGQIYFKVDAKRPIPRFGIPRLE